MKVCTCLFGTSNFQLPLISFIFVENVSMYLGNYHIGVKCMSIFNPFPSRLGKTKICEHVIDHIKGKCAVRTSKDRILCPILSILCMKQICSNANLYSQDCYENYIDLKHFLCFISYNSRICNISVSTLIILTFIFFITLMKFPWLFSELFLL